MVLKTFENKDRPNLKKTQRFQLADHLVIEIVCIKRSNTKKRGERDNEWRVLKIINCSLGNLYNRYRRPSGEDSRALKVKFLVYLQISKTHRVPLKIKIKFISLGAKPRMHG